MSQCLVVDNQAEDQVEQVPHLYLVRYGAGQKDDVVLGGPTKALHSVPSHGIPMRFVPPWRTVTATRVVNCEPGCSVPQYSETVLVGVVGDLTPTNKLSSNPGLADTGHPATTSAPDTPFSENLTSPRTCPGGRPVAHARR